MGSAGGSLLPVQAEVVDADGHDVEALGQDSRHRQGKDTVDEPEGGDDGQLSSADGIGVFGPHTTDAGKIAHHGKQGDEAAGVGQHRHHGGRGAETRHHKGGQQGFFLFGQGQHQTEQKAHGVLRHARVGGGIAVQAQKEVVQNEQSAGADLHDAQPLGRLELEGQDDESHGDQAPDLTQNEQKRHSKLLLGSIKLYYSIKRGFYKWLTGENLRCCNQRKGLTEWKFIIAHI